MRSHLAQLSKDSLIYGLGGAVGRYTGLILLPLYTRTFSAAQYGILESIASLGALLLAVTVLGLDGASAILYFAAEDPIERRRICTLWVWVSVLVSTPVTLISIAVAGWLSLAASGTPENATLFALGVASLPFSLLNVVFSSILRLSFRPRAYALLNFTLTTLIALISIYLVLFARIGPQGALWGTWLGTAAVALVGAWTVRDVVRLGSIDAGSRRLLRKLLRLGLPLVPASIALWIISFSNTLFLIQMIGPGEAGVFRVGVRLAAILGFGVWAFQLAWAPYSLSLAKDPDAPLIYSRVATLFTAGAVGASVLMSGFAPVLLLVFTTGDYAAAAAVVGLLSLAAAALGAYYIVAIGVNLAQRTGQIAWTTIVAAVANLALNALLIPLWGIVGAGLSALTANLLSTVLMYVVSQRFYPLPYEAGKIVAAWLAGSACVMAAGIFNVAVRPSVWLSAAFALGLSGVYVAALFGAKVVTPREIGVLRRALLGVVARRLPSSK